MAAKSFKKPVYENLGTTKVQSIEVQSETIPVPAVESTANLEKPSVKKKGRPKTKDVKGTCRNINVALPVTLLSKWEDVKIVYGNNLTAYITKLIEKDMKENYNAYKDIADSLNNFQQ